MCSGSAGTRQDFAASKRPCLLPALPSPCSPQTPCAEEVGTRWEFDCGCAHQEHLFISLFTCAGLGVSAFRSKAEHHLSPVQYTHVGTSRPAQGRGPCHCLPSGLAGSCACPTKSPGGTLPRWAAAPVTASAELTSASAVLLYHLLPCRAEVPACFKELIQPLLFTQKHTECVLFLILLQMYIFIMLSYFILPAVLKNA